jgi:hypothetical protein
VDKRHGSSSKRWWQHHVARGNETEQKIAALIGYRKELDGGPYR